MVAEATTTQLTVSEDYKEIALQWLTSTGNLKKFTENEKNQFFDICCAFKLNPIKKEVYGVKYGDNFNIIVGYETYLKRAQRTGLLDGFYTTTVKEGNDVKAICTIYRKDWSHPFVHEVYLSEYDTGKSLWTSKKITMIKKVAEAQAFRKCFTDEMGGLPYTREELPLEEDLNAPTLNPTSNNYSDKNLKNITPTSEQLAEQALKIAKPATPVKEKLYTREESEKVKELLTAKYQDGTEIFTEEDKKVFRKLIVEQGGKACIESVERTIEERVGLWKDQKDAEELQNAAEGIF